MASKLILSKPELNEDVFFTDTTYWTVGATWTVFNNSVAGAICTAGAGNTLDITDSPLKFSTSYKYTLYVELCTGSSTFLIIAGNIIPITLSATPLVYQAIISTTSALNGVSFICSGGDTVNINYLKITESPSEYDIDITDDIDIPITFSVADIKDPSKRNAAYSKNVTIPATKNNNKYFTHIYEISGDGSYNPNKKCKAVVIEDGIELFNGICQLKQINRVRNGLNNYNQISYEVCLLGKLADVFYLLGDTLLSDLDFSEYNHTYNITNQRDSWYTQIQKNGGNYVNTLNGGNLTISSCTNNAGRLQLNFSGAHGLVANDWFLIPDNAITAGSEFYYGEHAVYSVVSSTAIIVRCPFDVVMGTILTTTATVKKHSKLGEGYVYPMTNYGGVTANTWAVKNFYPAIYLREYMVKMFKKIGFIWDSTEFNSIMFRKLIIPYNGGELKLTQAQIDAKKFQASSTTLVTSSYLISDNYDNSGNYAYPLNYRGHSLTGFGVAPGYTPFANTAPITLDVPINDDTTLPNFDNGGVFNTGTYRFVCPVTGNYDLTSNVQVIHNYVLPGGVTQADTTNGTSKFFVNTAQPSQTGGRPEMQLQIYDYTTSAVVTTGTNTITAFQSSATPISINVFNAALVAGRSYGVRLIYTYSAKAQFWTTQFTVPYNGNITVNYTVAANASFKNNIQSVALGDGDYLNLNIAVPQKIKCVDLLKTVIKLFNLYIQPDSSNDKKLYIETRNNFYSLGTTIDITDKLDTDQPIVITPMAELNAKYYEYKYADNKSTLGLDHKNKYGVGYGDLIYNVDNDFIPDTTNSLDVIFAATILSEVTQGAGSGRIIGDTSNEGLRLLYFNMSSSVNQVSNNTWLHSGLTGSYSRRIFPYAGHLDKVEAPNYDLNWTYPKGVYFDYDSWTSRGLFNQHYKQMIDEITDKNSRIVKCNLHLTAKDIFNLDFRNLFVIDGHFLRLNKVSDYLVNKNVTTPCEFIKVESKAPYIVPLYSSFSPVEDPNYSSNLRTINGEQLPEISMLSNGSNDLIQNESIVVNGSENNVNSYNSRTVSVNGDGNTTGAGLTNVLIQGDNNVVYPNISNVSLINSSNITVTESNVTYMNGLLVSNVGGVIDSEIITTDKSLDITYNNRIVYVDATAGNITLTWDSSTMTDCKVYIVRVDISVNTISITDSDATAVYIGNALPYNLGMVQYDHLPITSIIPSGGTPILYNF